MNGGLENPEITGSFSSGATLDVSAPIQPGAAEAARGQFGLSIPEVTDSTTAIPGRTVFETSDGVPGVVQELASGFKVVRVIDGPSGLEQLYNLTLEGRATLEPAIDGYLIVDSSGVKGALSAPWAIDANGQSQPTRLELVDHTLRQITEPNPDVVYPIVADPNWMYSYTYTTRTSPNTNWIKLHNCFNCYFPIGGAPALWPEPNQLLPLITYGQNMECRMGTVIISGLQDYSWMFRATANHVDGYGSYIYFFLRYVSGVPSLIVTASIVNEPAIGREWMTTLASAQWQTFATNLGYK